jgi:dienelactone hydrolase
MIVTGSVPILSEFWVKSSHPVAVESRNGVNPSELENFQKESFRFDLIQTVKEIQSKVLFQFGTRDPWIEKNQVTLFEKSVSKVSQKIEWTEDDHAMDSAQSVQNRIKFLDQCFER